MPTTARSRRPGFTLTEVAVGAGLGVVIGLMVAMSINWSRQTVTGGVQRLDQLGELRTACVRIGLILGYATEVLYPPVSKPGPYHQVVFRSQTNELLALYVSTQGQLSLLTYGAPPRVEPLVRRAIRLNARRPSHGLVEYSVTVFDEDNKREVTLGSSLWIRNRE
jgi:hypothetical protein